MLKSFVSKSFIPFFAALLLAFLPNPALAAGHGGGGHGGGGGFHGGGGSYGGYRGGAYGGYRGGNFGGSNRGGAYGSRGGGSYSRGFSSARGGIADGNFHSFGGSRGFSGGRSSVGASRGIADGNFHSFGAGASRGGFGNNSFNRGGFGRGGFGDRGWGGRGWGGRGWGWGGRGWRGGCWGCGFGWGFGWGWGLGWGWGWGWPWAGAWWGPGWGWGWDWPVYAYDPDWGYSAYPDPYYDYGPPYQAPAPPPPNNNNDPYGDYDSYGPPYALPPDNGGYGQYSAEQPAYPQDQYASDPGPSTGNVAESMPTVLLYLKDGTVYPASQYWVAGSTVHYVVAYGGESTVAISDVDMQRTINENAKRGVRFNLRPRSYYGDAPTASAPSNAEPAMPAPAAAPAAKGQPIAEWLQLQPAA